jgi:hypothetical protein
VTEDHLCLAPNQSEYSFASDRWFCSMPKNHGGDMHIAFMEHEPAKGVTAAWFIPDRRGKWSWVDANPVQRS